MKLAPTTSPGRYLLTADTFPPYGPLEASVEIAAGAPPFVVVRQGTDVFRLPFADVEVYEVRYLDLAGEDRVLDRSSYAVDRSGEFVRLLCARGGPWPRAREQSESVRILFYVPTVRHSEAEAAPAAPAAAASPAKPARGAKPPKE